MCAYQNTWIKKKREQLRKFFGERCNNPECQSSEKLQFAHIKETGLNGEGRGRFERILDVNRNPESYILLCKDCHKEFDRGNL